MNGHKMKLLLQGVCQTSMEKVEQKIKRKALKQQFQKWGVVYTHPC